MLPPSRKAPDIFRDVSSGSREAILSCPRTAVTTCCSHAGSLVAENIKKCGALGDVSKKLYPSCFVEHKLTFDPTSFVWEICPWFRGRERDAVHSLSHLPVIRCHHHIVSEVSTVSVRSTVFSVLKTAVSGLKAAVEVRITTLSIAGFQSSRIRVQQRCAYVHRKRIVQLARFV